MAGFAVARVAQDAGLWRGQPPGGDACPPPWSVAPSAVATGRGDVPAAAAPFVGMYDDGPSRGMSVVEAAIDSAEALTARTPPDLKGAEAALVPALRWLETVVAPSNVHDRLPDGLNRSTAATFAGAAHAEIQAAMRRLRLGLASNWQHARAVARAAAEHLAILSGEKDASTSRTVKGVGHGLEAGLHVQAAGMLAPILMGLAAEAVPMVTTYLLSHPQAAVDIAEVLGILGILTLEAGGPKQMLEELQTPEGRAFVLQMLVERLLRRLGGDRRPQAPSESPVAGPSPVVHEGRQGKHVPSHPNYIPVRSELTVSASELGAHAGTGQQVGTTRIGLPGSKERVDFGRPIGRYVDPVTGISTPTSIGIIHYSSTGIHIVPARPKP